jgi:hypoxanthine phosphoribosyltransferase
MDTKYLLITWPEYHLLAQKLAAAIMNHSEKFDEIVAVARGGLTLGHLLSDLLQLPVSTFAIQSYTDIQTQGTMKITQELGKSIAGKRVLLVDDVSDSGKTFKRATEYIRSCKPAELTTVAMFFKPHSIFRPDYYVKQSNKWIIFPYEPTEMIKLITEKMVQEGKSKAEIQEFLTNLGFREGQVAFVRKHHIR